MNIHVQLAEPYFSVTELVEVTVRIVPLILPKHPSDTKSCFDRLSNRCDYLIPYLRKILTIGFLIDSAQRV